MLTTIKGRLVTLLSVMCVLLLLATGIGNFALSANHQSFNTVFGDRIIPLRQFSLIRDAYDDLLATSRALRNRQGEPGRAREKIEAGLGALRTQWAAYLATYLTPEEKALADEMQRRIDHNGAVAADILRRLAAGGTQDFDATHAALVKGMEEANAVLGKLTALQVREAQAEFERAETHSGWSRLILLALLVLATAAIGFGLYTVLALIVRPLGGMTGTMARLADGDV